MRTHGAAGRGGGQAMRSTIATLGVFSLLSQMAQASGTVRVDVEGVRSDRGQVVVELCTASEKLDEPCRLHSQGPAQAGMVSLSIPDIAPGTYAAWAWHDEDGTGRLKRDLLGRPRDGVGYSNDAQGPLGLPDFGDASFEVGPRGAETTVRLRYHRR